MRIYRTDPAIRNVLDYFSCDRNYSVGIKGLAEWCFACADDEELYVREYGEYIFSCLDVEDEDPRQEKHYRYTVAQFVLSDYFYLFLTTFYQCHRQMYNELTRGVTIEAHDPIPCRQCDAIAIEIWL